MTRRPISTGSPCEAAFACPPANTTVVSRLPRPEMKVEIEATAFRG